MGRTLYHTVEDDGNPDLIRANAPFLCKDTSEQLEAWFGEGYYFWDTLIQLPHWWGKSHYIRRNKNMQFALPPSCVQIMKCWT